MAQPVVLVLFLCLLGLVIGFVYTEIKNGVSGIKIMLLGINITLFGGIIVLDPSSDLGGAEYIIMILGLILSGVGFSRSDVF